MIHVLYSADYEIFLGENFLPEEDVVIAPTEGLLDTCDELGVALTLFVDVACLWRYREEGLTAFPDAVERQLRDAVRRGHDVQAHLHPHWLEARRDGLQWRADLRTFLLGRLADDAAEVRRRAEELLRRAAGYLEDVVRPVDDSYRCAAFRAGNYGLQPRAQEVLAALLAAGYTIDSSVVPGYVAHEEPNAIDFSRVPRLANYRLAPETGLDAAAAEGLFEIPVGAARYGIVDAPRLAARKLGRTLARRRGTRPPAPHRGRAIQVAVAPGGRTATLRRRARKALAGHIAILELARDAGPLLEITQRYLAGLDAADDVYFSFSCHPKTLDELSFDALRTYHRELERLYGAELAAISFRDAAEAVTACSSSRTSR